MADYKILEENSQFHTHQYLIDKVADLENLPADEVGSVAIVAETSEVYIMNNKKEWSKL